MAEEVTSTETAKTVSPAGNSLRFLALLVGLFAFLSVLIVGLLFAMRSGMGEKLSNDFEYNKYTFEELTSGQGEASRVTEKSEVVVRSSAELSDLWGRVNSGLRDDLPEVNFDESIVLAVFYGEAASGGYSVKVDKVEDKAGKVKVSIIETIPGEDCMNTMAITNPYTMISMQKVDKEFVFDRTSRTVDCTAEQN